MARTAAPARANHFQRFEEWLSAGTKGLIPAVARMNVSLTERWEFAIRN